MEISLSLKRLRVEILDLCELALVPVLAMFLPWQLMHRVCRAIIARTSLYSASDQRAVLEAAKVLQIAEPAKWRRDFRFTGLMDTVDLYLSLSRTAAWHSRFCPRVGAWPAPGQPFIAFTFHWGAGLMALHDLQRSGIRAHMLVNAAKPEHFEGRWVRYRYIQRRIQRIKELLGQETIDALANLRPVLKALKEGQSIVAVIDVPADSADQTVGARLLGQEIRIPRALLRIAHTAGLPVMLYWTGIDATTAKRRLMVDKLQTSGTLEEVAQAVIARLESLIQQDAAAWHLWGEWPRFQPQKHSPNDRHGQ